MIVVDTSALMAVVLAEPAADACLATMIEADRLLISAGTIAESLIVGQRRGVGEELATLIERFGFEVVSVTPASARGVAAAYDAWGKGNHRAALNLGDSFAYQLAKYNGCPLLYVGSDFAHTDVEGALG